MRKPRVVLHIGRNKSGSTTIQDACLASRDTLARGGIGYGMFGHLWQSRSDVPGWMTFDALADHAKANSETCWLVSNEFMSAWPIEFTREAARALRECDVTIIAYVRRYDHWIRSSYAEDTKTSRNRLDIDRYLDRMRPRISALPNLNGWAECFGWERMRIRSFALDDMVSSDLIADFSHSLGLLESIEDRPSSNVAPHWIETELIRALLNCTDKIDCEDWESEVVLPLAELLREVIVQQPDTPYLSEEQSCWLLAAYNSDLDVLRAHGHNVSSVVDTPPPRTFVPSFARVPEDITRCFLVAATSQSFAGRHPKSRRAVDLLGESSG